MNLLLIITFVLFGASLLYLVHSIGYWRGWMAALDCVQKMRSGISK